MTNFFAGQRTQGYGRTTSFQMRLTSLVSLVAIVLTYIIGVVPLDVTAKTLGFSAIIAAFLLMCVGLHVSQTRPKSDEHSSADEAIDSGLLMLDEASEFFAGSLNPADAFRLVSTVIRRLIPFQTIVLLRPNEKRAELRVVEIIGINPNNESGNMGFEQDLAQ